VLWGEKDRALGTALLNGLEAFVEELEIIRFPDLGHWLHIDGAARINQELLHFLA
jgi:pimeloyl-ACP methyl ester carboxylesterase